MKKLLFLLTIISLFSCSPTKRLAHFANKHPELFDNSVKDSVSHTEKIVIRDTTIIIHGEKLIVKDYALCDSLNKAQLKKKTVKSGRITASVEIKDGDVKVECLTDSLIKELQLRDKIIYDYKSHSESKTITIYKPTKFDIFCKWFFFIFLLIIALLIYFRKNIL